MAVYRLPDLIDINSIQKMVDAHYRATGMPVGIVDAIENAVLAGSGWQDICARFHRANPVSYLRCLESESIINERMVEGEACQCECKNGMIDIGMPIIVSGQHLATMFLGQFFYEDELPDRVFFVKQALELGFDQQDYLEALDAVPRFSREKVKYILEYNMALVSFISDLAMQSLQKKSVENRIHESEHFSQTLMDAILTPIFSKDTDGRYKSCNAAFEKYLGLSKNQIIGKSVYDLAPAELADKYNEMDVALLHQGGEQVYESSVRYADGTVHDVIFNKTTFNNADGSLGGIVGVLIDISERKKAEEALRHSQNTLQKAQETAHLGIWEWDVRKNELYWSDELYRIHGLAPGTSVPAEPGYFMVHPADRKLLQDEIYNMLSNEAHQLTEYRIVRPDGSVRHIYSSAELLKDASGEPEKFVGIAYDITEKKKLEEQLLQSQKMEAIGTLAGGVAHDFNNILTAIIGYASILKMRMAADSPLREYANEILGASERAANLTGSLLSFSRKQPINLRPVSLNQIISGISNLLYRVIGEDIEFSCHLYHEPLIVLADNGQIEQVLMNLVANARDSMPNGGLLTIRTEPAVVDSSHAYLQPGTYALMTVSDTGRGMDESTRQRIFEPFFTTKELGKGTGLGLSIVYGIIRQHNGEIKVDSEPGIGTVFSVYLKLIEIKDEQVETEIAQQVTGGTETILLAEDDEGVRLFFKGVLEEYGYRVIATADGDEAVARYLESSDEIRLLLFDLVMPKKNGKEAYDDIIRSGGDLPVIFSSGYPADIIHQKGIVGDGITLITKPVSPYILLSEIRKVLDHAKE
jgi:two-component system, cell cycle sensor histidine kinase and response regulator CckA